MHWYESGEADANESEMLLFALMLAYRAATAGGLAEWADKVVAEKAAAEEATAWWKPSAVI